MTYDNKFWKFSEMLVSGIELVLGTRVKSVDVRRKTLLSSTGETISYKFLIIATGARVWIALWYTWFRFSKVESVCGWENAINVYDKLLVLTIKISSLRCYTLLLSVKSWIVWSQWLCNSGTSVRCCERLFIICSFLNIFVALLLSHVSCASRRWSSKNLGWKAQMLKTFVT